MQSDTHIKFSLVKSGLRILACATLMTGAYFTAGFLLIVAELLGIAEEIW